MSDKFENAPEALVLVHPGSLCGSARMAIGKQEANAIRENILEEVARHNGPLVVIDGFLSDELSFHENSLINEALVENAAEGHLALRLWGCDAGEDTYSGWTSYGAPMEEAVFDGQEQAAKMIAARLADHRIVITGAWATDDLSTGCATSVLVALREALGGQAEVVYSSNVLYEPFEDDLEDEDCDVEA